MYQSLRVENVRVLTIFRPNLRILKLKNFLKKHILQIFEWPIAGFPETRTFQKFPIPDSVDRKKKLKKSDFKPNIGLLKISEFGKIGLQEEFRN